MIDGDSEESVIDKLGDPDERLTLREALADDEGDSPVDSEMLGDIIGAAGLAGSENLYWEHDGEQYLVEIQNDVVSSKGDPVSCKDADVTW